MNISSEMLSNELLSELHGQVSLNAVHRFITCFIIFLLDIVKP